MIDGERPDLSGRSILVIEDETFSRNMIARVLKSLGAVVIFSGTEDANMAAVKRVAEFRGLNILGYLAKPVTRNALGKLLGGLWQPSKSENRRLPRSALGHGRGNYLATQMLSTG